MTDSCFLMLNTYFRIYFCNFHENELRKANGARSEKFILEEKGQESEKRVSSKNFRKFKAYYLPLKFLLKF